MRVQKARDAGNVELLKQLKKYWGYDAFRPGQEAIISSVMEGKDTLALLPTGGGKSLCFQLPALMLPGVCLVVSPLIALMEDQVSQLLQKQIPAACIVGTQDETVIRGHLQAAISGRLKLLYVAPERLESTFFKEHLKQMKISVLVVDEAHCLSQWGFDFRPSYLKISAIRRLLPGVPVLALTATATRPVSMDIMLHLGFRQKNKIAQSFERPNLIYAVRYAEDKEAQLKRVLEGIYKAQPKSSGIIYADTRRGVDFLTDLLIQQGYRALGYHAGMEPEKRTKNGQAWMKDKKAIMVATNAFGMGIDKSDVRFVIHMHVPDSPEAYYQEAGRAGRDGKSAYAVLIYNDGDKHRLDQAIATEFPAEEQLRRFYGALCRYLGLTPGYGSGNVYRIDLAEFSRHISLPFVHTAAALRQLVRAGYFSIRSHQEWQAAMAQVLILPDQVFELNLCERHATVLEALIRSNDGIFDQWCKLHTAWLAASLNMETEALEKNLQELTSMQILRYLPGETASELEVVLDAVDERQLPWDQSDYRKRRKTKQERAAAMWSYVQESDKCRSKLLLSYFDEWKVKDCGRCDVCRAKLHADPNYKLLKASMQQLLPLYEQTAELDILELTALFGEADLEQILTGLCDRGWLICQKNGKYSKGKV